MSRTLRARSACALALTLLGAGCQSYNFNPVGHCLIQPGTKRVTLSNISSADVLFVVDDSGSMGEEQAALASNFSRFIDNLNAANLARQSAGLEPFDFHIAVTTTSIYWNYTTLNPSTGLSNVCASNCSGTAGQLVCCKPDGTPAKQPKSCTPGVTTCPSGTNNGTPWTTTCSTSCQGFKGEPFCCSATDGSFPVGSVTDVQPCSLAGTTCGTLQTHYDFGACTAGVAVDEWPYPGGDFVSWSSSTAANPRVLHFDKELYTGDPATAKNQQGFTRTQLVNFFKGIDASGSQGNIKVGTCGSGEEQALQAARLAIQKAQAGQQKDTYARTSATPQPTWTSATRTATSDADWLKGSNSKLVVVFVGDEDDCSSPKDPSRGVVMLAEAPGQDACSRDATTDAPLGHKEYPVDDIANFFMGLGRPFGAAFIFPAVQETCTADTCTAGPGVCSTAQAPGYRLLATANALRARGADVVGGSICDPNFGAILDSIAELVKPPSGLILPSLPATDEVTVLRIAAADGQTRKVCGRPLQGFSGTLAEAQNAIDPETGKRWDWWFTVDGNPAPPTTGVTTFVYINPAGSCIANPGETYSADYLGKVPSGGCGDDAAAGVTGDQMCARLLGGTAENWTCFAGVDPASQKCLATTGTWNGGVSPTGTGTCVCGPRGDPLAPKEGDMCPAGTLP